MKCHYCKTGETAPGFVTSTTVLDSLTIVTKQVPAKVCGNCAESYHDMAVVSRLEEITDEAERSGVQALVRKYDGDKPQCHRAHPGTGATNAHNHRLMLSDFPVNGEKNCFLCRNDELKPGITDTSITRGDFAIVVKGVPAERCTNCGEPYLTPAVSRRLKEQFKDAERTGVEFMVRRYTPDKVPPEAVRKQLPG